MDALNQLVAALGNLKHLEHLPEIRRMLEDLHRTKFNIQDPVMVEHFPKTAPKTATKVSAQPIELGSDPVTIEVEITPDVRKVLDEMDKEPVKVDVSEDYASNFEELKSLLDSNAWPPMVDSDLICDDDNLADKLLRAEGMIEFMIDESLEGKKFLDFGCGEGHVVLKSIEKKPLLSVGYDITNQGWSTLGLHEPHLVTTNWDHVLSNGPYDLVLMYDVLDHVEGTHQTVIDTLKKAKSALKPGGRLYIRCHPWVSRHATHLYKKLNKAYAHLVFSDVELARLGYGGGQKCQKIIHPHATYKQWFNDADLDLVNENAIQENLEDFFHQTPVINDRIRAHYKGVSLDPDLAAGRAFPSFQLRIQWVDYILKSS